MWPKLTLLTKFKISQTILLNLKDPAQFEATPLYPHLLLFFSSQSTCAVEEHLLIWLAHTLLIKLKLSQTILLNLKDPTQFEASTLYPCFLPVFYS
jgi:hypothetical protein